jgi:uncharacterized protein (TIGR00369 family)
VSGILDVITRARAERDFSRMADAIPYSKWLGISVDEVDGELLGKLAFSDMLIGNPVLPALHGGTLGALLESTAIFKVLWEAETLILPKTINITVAYLRSGRPQDTFAKGSITKQGRRVASVYVEAWQDDRSRPIASAHVHVLIRPSDG